MAQPDKCGKCRKKTDLTLYAWEIKLFISFFLFNFSLMYHSEYSGSKYSRQANDEVADYTFDLYWQTCTETQLRKYFSPTPTRDLTVHLHVKSLIYHGIMSQQELSYPAIPSF